MKKFSAGLLTLGLCLAVSTTALADGQIVSSPTNKSITASSFVYRDYEPNNRPETANPYSVGGQIIGRLGDYYSSDGGWWDITDVYKFTVDKRQKVTFQLGAPQNVRLHLWSPRGVTFTDKNINSFTVYLEPGVTYELTVNTPTIVDPLEYNVYSYVVE
ncbi:hypothetical protein [Brevibacillus laterosporus]|uniref:hypothetical protein n=1 Tax=Brevibacillus laterosporus TaxID=1465 RepID=UPI002654F22E|nr:hypothetical protein [Brevibacillus laterosporus]MDN9010146.1 hypothetical protein [Brevibacillus laterosporus]MDO0941400.1 hypothetical protein [Brevibacillus laterosporus]